MEKTICRKEAIIIEMHFTWPGGGQYYSFTWGGQYYSFTWGRPLLQLMSSPPIGVNVLGGIYVVIRCCGRGLLGLIIFQPLQHGYIRSKGV